MHEAVCSIVHILSLSLSLSLLSLSSLSLSLSLLFLPHLSKYANSTKFRTYFSYQKRYAFVAHIKYYI